MYHGADESSSKTASFKPWKRPNKRCTVAQKKALVDYMKIHSQLARYECDTATADVEWQRLADTLNQSGTVKTVEAWKVTWRDLRRKAVRDQAEAQATNTSINAISGQIREIMADSDDDLGGKSSNICISPTRSISIHSPAEESDQDQDLENSDLAQPQESLVQTMEAPAEDMEAQARASPASELESLQGPPESASDSSPCTSPIPINKTRCTQDQINSLVECMAINTSMAFGRQNTPKKAGDWKRLRQFLNRMGPAKRTVAWQKTWRDLKRSAVMSKTKPARIKPTSKKILDIIEAYTEKLKDNPNELSADDSDMFVPPDGTVHCEVSKSPLSEYLILPEVDRSKIRDTGKHNVKVSPAQRGSSKMSPVHNSAIKTIPASYMHNENEYYSDTDSERSENSKKLKKMRCTNAQKYAIVDYMAQHPDLATSRASDGDSYAKWRQLSKYLNKIGTAKTTASWKRTWRELKTNARSNRASNNKWAEINQRILNICENASNLKRQAQSVIKTAEEHDGPCPTDDMPLLSLRRQSDTEPHTQPEVVLSEEDVSDDITEPEDQKNSQSKQSSEGSPERQNSMSPRQRSGEASPVQIKKEQSQSQYPQSKNTRCTPSQINALMNYMAKHPSLGKARCLYMPKGRDPWYNEWRRLTGYLNSLNKMGPAKSTTGWKCTWRSLCLNARRKKSKQCPSYESVYKRVLKILEHEEVPTVTKVETIEDFDSLPAELQSPDPLKCEQVPKYTTSQVSHSSGQMSPGRHTDKSHIQRGSRMYPVRISDNVSPVRRGSDRMSPGCSSDLPVHRTSLVTDNYGHRVKLGNKMHSSRWNTKPKKIRSSNGQLRALADYMIAHPDLATDKYIDHREPAWVHLTKYLNEIGPARKRTDTWKRTWRDIKNGVRARGRSNQRSGCLERFREEKVLRLIGMSSPDRKNAVGSDDDNMDEEYVVPEPEVILTPRAPSPSAQYNLAEILARSPAESEAGDNGPSMDEALLTTSLLQTILQEVRRNNELQVKHNVYLKEILKQVRSQKCMHGTRHTDRDSPINHGNAHEQKHDVMENTLEKHIQEENSSLYNENDSDEIPVRPSPVIRPVSLSSLTNTPKQPYERLKVQSILQGKVKPATPKGKLVRLQDGTMVLVPENMKTPAASNQDTNGESPTYAAGNVPQNQKLEVNEEDSWCSKTTGINKC